MGERRSHPTGSGTGELILGGQRSGKSRCAESRAADWLALPGRSAVLLATALAGDDEMRARIARHRHDRAERVPDLATDEVPRELAAAVKRHSEPDRMVLVDCLSLWLTNLRMPMQGAAVTDAELDRHVADLCEALRSARGPVVLVSNEIGLGLAPLGAEARRFVDDLGRLHQAVAAQCARVTLMVAGIEMPVRRADP
ncbi:bifunctional adenosylcobinamide kinase/adenosylcobinamide-phosphate guanylyltransferase [Methylibium petroleiphilum]|uniref:bifunctional adenosylcobinamide kinase/adenosylcobinamide-phosphate guanylyltransferase n=1 Tax=Methylibium petroleiphilum TaxID=105560 RepID=UPI003D2B55EE